MPYTKDDVGDTPTRKLSDAEKQKIADEWNANEADDTLRKWTAEMETLDRKIMADARYWEEVASGAVSPAAKQRMDGLIAEREALRAAKP